MGLWVLSGISILSHPFSRKPNPVARQNALAGEEP
jgi:hypothetical protein